MAEHPPHPPLHPITHPHFISFPLLILIIRAVAVSDECVFSPGTLVFPFIPWDVWIWVFALPFPRSDPTYGIFIYLHNFFLIRFLKFHFLPLLPHSFLFLIFVLFWRHILYASSSLHHILYTCMSVLWTHPSGRTWTTSAVCFCFVCGFEEEDYLENLHSALFCILFKLLWVFDCHQCLEYVFPSLQTTAILYHRKLLHFRDWRCLVLSCCRLSRKDCLIQQTLFWTQCPSKAQVTVAEVIDVVVGGRMKSWGDLALWRVGKPGYLFLHNVIIVWLKVILIMTAKTTTYRV